jgi:hypothetical protein
VSESRILVNPDPDPRFEDLKVPKRENFSIAFFAQSEPIWICDVGTSKKIEFYYQLIPDFDGFWFFAAY